MRSLSRRLEFIASQVPQGAKLCDIGTDHAYLPIALIKGCRIKSAIAADINEKPLETARENIKRSGANGITLRLCDGLSGINSGEADTVVIAGMGGEVIAGILDRCSWIKDREILLILQPTTSAEVLRRWLCDNLFGIETETALIDGGRVYSVITTRFSGAPVLADKAFLYVGKVDPGTAAGALYIKKQLNRCLGCAKALESIKDRQSEYLYFRSAAEEIAKLLGEKTSFS